MAPNLPLNNHILHLLEPITASKPAGDSIHYTSDWEELKEFRREDDQNLSYGIWETDLKRPDWDELSTKCEDVLSHKTKDLQIVGWLIESWIAERSITGFLDGIDLLEAFLKTFWDVFYPQEGDAEYRISILEWIDRAIEARLVFCDLNNYEGRQVNVDDWRYACFNERIRAKGESYNTDRMSIEDFRSGLNASSQDFIAQQKVIFHNAQEAVERICAFLDDKLGQDGPSFAQTRHVIDEIFQIFDLEYKPTPKQVAQEASSSPQEEPQAAEVYDRNAVYTAIGKLVQLAKKIDPQGISPLLIEIAIAWRNKSFDQILNEVKTNEDPRYEVFKIFGV